MTFDPGKGYNPRYWGTRAGGGLGIVDAFYMTDRPLAPTWPAGWTQFLVFGVGEPVGYGPIYTYGATGPPSANSVTASTFPSFNNSCCLMVFEVLDSIRRLAFAGGGQTGHDAGGPGFRFPDLVVNQAARLLALQSRVTSAEPWSDPYAAGGWIDVVAPRGTSATAMTLSGGADKVLTTQAGLAIPIAGVVRVSSAADPSNFMDGRPQDYTGTSLTLHPIRYGGAGTFTDWIISLAMFDESPLGDRQLVNAQTRQAAVPGTYGGFQAPEGSETNNLASVVTVAYAGAAARIGRSGSSGIQEAVMSATAVLA